MIAIKKVLLPTDFSRGAARALRHAVVLADRLGAELHLLHVAVGPFSRDGGMIGFPEMEELCTRMRVEALRCHRDLLEFRQKDNLPVRSAVRCHADAAQPILEYADDHQIDLIVMAPSGYSQDGRFTLGSTAEKVIRLAPCPVLTSGLRGLYRPGVLRRILVPTDFSAASSSALEWARVLAKQTQAHLTVLHVVEPPEFSVRGSEAVLWQGRPPHVAYAELEQFYRSAKGPDVPHLLSVMRGRAADRIADLANRDQIDLIVQGSQGRTGTEYALLGSVAEVVVRLAPCPVLTVKAPAEACEPGVPKQRERCLRAARTRPGAVPVINRKTEVAT